MSLDAFTRKNAINVTAELFDDSYVLRVQCSDDPHHVECSFNQFIGTLKTLRADIGKVTLKIGNFQGGETLHRRVLGLAHHLTIPVIVARAVEQVLP